MNLADKISGHGKDNDKDGSDADDEIGDEMQAGLVPGPHQIFLLFHHHQNEGRFRDVGIPDKQFFSAGAFGFKDLGCGGIFRRGQGHLIKNLPKVSRRRLQNTGPVDNEQITADPGLKGKKLSMKALGLEGGAQDERRAVGRLMSDRDHKVGTLAISQENIARVPALIHHFGKPFLTAVIKVLQVIGAAVGDLSSLHIDDSEIRKAPETFLQVF